MLLTAIIAGRKNIALEISQIDPTIVTSRIKMPKIFFMTIITFGYRKSLEIDLVFLHCFRPDFGADQFQYLWQ